MAPRIAFLPPLAIALSSSQIFPTGSTKASRISSKRTTRFALLTTMCDSEQTKSKSVSKKLSILTHQTEPIEGQKTGTSGLRKKTSVLTSNPSYLPNWVQSLFNALGGSSTLSGQTLILGGDGRYFNKSAAQIILRMAAANGLKRVIVGTNALLTTPAVSALIPARKALGGIILTASHNPAGPDADWGIKYNTQSGAPALEKLTDAIHECTLNITEYKMADFGFDLDLSIEGTTSFQDGRFVVEVVNPVHNYLNMMKSIFDFDAIRQLMARPDFSMLFDAMHAATGEYAQVIFSEQLGAGPSSVINADPKEDFGGAHPDPNLTYAAALVDRLDPQKNDETPQFGAASDGDGDRNMILGSGVFVSPADSVAIIADYAAKCIPYFSTQGVKGVARSMPTASALDRVAEELGVRHYHTPTGWKYFTELMDAGKVNICGEESFGTGSDHIREKDGIWAVLAWLSILAYENKNTEVGSFVTVKDILLSHWQKYGRTYNMRYDYEAVDSNYSEIFLINLIGMAVGAVPYPAEVQRVEQFEYKDLVVDSVASNQGVIVVPKAGGRIVFRLSGTGSTGATIRIYFESYEPPSSDLGFKDPKVHLKDLSELALSLSRVGEFTERTAPTVIT